MIRLLLLTVAAIIVAGCQPKPFNATVIVEGKEGAIEGVWQPRSTGTDTEFGAMTIADGRVSFATGGEAKLIQSGKLVVLQWREFSKSLVNICGGDAPFFAEFVLTDKDQLLAAETPGQILEVRFYDTPTSTVVPPEEELCRIATWER